MDIKLIKKECEDITTKELVQYFLFLFFFGLVFIISANIIIGVIGIFPSILYFILKPSSESIFRVRVERGAARKFTRRSTLYKICNFFNTIVATCSILTLYGILYAAFFFIYFGGVDGRMNS